MANQNDRAQFDIMLKIGSEVVAITGIHANTLDDATRAAIEVVGKGDYAGHVWYRVENSQWVAVETCEVYGDFGIYTAKDGEIMAKRRGASAIGFLPVQFGGIQSCRDWLDACAG